MISANGNLHLLHSSGKPMNRRNEQHIYQPISGKPDTIDKFPCNAVALSVPCHMLGCDGEFLHVPPPGGITVPGFPHQCPKCGARALFKDAYPKISFEKITTTPNTLTTPDTNKPEGDQS